MSVLPARCLGSVDSLFVAVPVAQTFSALFQAFMLAVDTLNFFSPNTDTSSPDILQFASANVISVEDCQDDHSYIDEQHISASEIQVDKKGSAL